jgi:hypothetical protein
MTTNVITSGASTQDFKFIDQIIDLETERKVSRVKDAYKYGIMTACFIDGHFCLVSDYTLPEGMKELLEKA